MKNPLTQLALFKLQDVGGSLCNYNYRLSTAVLASHHELNETLSRQVCITARVQLRFDATALTAEAATLCRRM